MEINKQAQSQGFMYGLQAVRFKEKLLGYIEKNSFDLGGTKAESVDIEAEQVPTAPVLTILQKNATIKPKFNLIQLKYEYLKEIMGGELVTEGEGESAKVVGWKAPAGLVQISGAMQIDTPSGHRIDIFNGTLNANLGGGLKMGELAKAECELSVNAPENGGEPYQIIDIPEDGAVKKTAEAPNNEPAE